MASSERMTAAIDSFCAGDQRAAFAVERIRTGRNVILRFPRDIEVGAALTLLFRAQLKQFERMHEVEIRILVCFLVIHSAREL